jgi:hypothetical protein
MSVPSDLPPIPQRPRGTEQSAQPGPAGDVRGWVYERPAPRLRSNSEIRQGLAVVQRISALGDDAVSALAHGAVFAAQWVARTTTASPARGLELPDPCLWEIAEEIQAAGKVAAAAVRLPGYPWCDAARIAGRGIEEWLAWVYVDSYPTPIWLGGDPTVQDVRRAVLGRVGATRLGLNGPGASRERFVYDVARVVEVLNGVE